MPFEHLLPSPLTRSMIRANAPAASGVYGISNSREWIYIGETDNIQGTLLAHLHDPTSAVMKRQPTGFVWEVCDLARRTLRQDRLIVECGPVCNRQGAAR
jgi:hypothetical protein